MDGDAKVRRVAEAMAKADGLEFVIQMPANERIKNPNFEGHVNDRVREAERLCAAVEAMST